MTSFTSFKDFLVCNAKNLLIGAFCGLVGLIIISLNQVATNIVRLTVEKGTTIQALMIREFRTIYSDDVVSRAVHYGLVASPDYRHKDKAIPLPATLTIELGKAIHDKYPDVNIRLYSDYPFPWRRATGGIKDQFERDALAFLRKHPEQSFARFDEVNGENSYRYAVADVMKESCVQCHNTAPDSPKTDWKVGDVRGVLEVQRPLNALSETIQRTLIVTYVITIGLAFAALIGFQSAMGYLSKSRLLAEEQAARRATLNVELGFGVDAVRGMLDDQSHEVEAVMSALNQARSRILVSAEQLANSSAETAAAVSETTSVVEEVKQTAEVSHGKASSVSNSSKDDLQFARAGQEATNEAVLSMSGVRDQLKRTIELMKQLEDRNREVMQIVATVASLAQQSNILAINAAIEATKAGEFGKGFNVVALYVKQLSNESKAATTKIEKILNEVVEAISVAAKTTEEANPLVERSESYIQHASEVILRLSKSLDSTAQAASQIEVSSQQQLVGMKQAVIAMDSVNEASKHNMECATDLEVAAADLNELSQRLKNTTSKLYERVQDDLTKLSSLS